MLSIQVKHNIRIWDSYIEYSYMVYISVGNLSFQTSSIYFCNHKTINSSYEQFIIICEYVDVRYVMTYTRTHWYLGKCRNGGTVLLNSGI